ncbi:MAG: hypothetical protein D6816_17040 [Bacteroidetes bacterium]|nr:MAG: hypothetical protein D6816_17040 [Bacteroidota bacterium]
MAFADSNDEFLSALDAEDVISINPDPAPIAASEFSSRSTFIGLAAKFARIKDKLAAAGNAWLRLPTDEKDPFPRDNLTPEEFANFGGSEVGMKWFDGVTPADIQAFKERRFFEVLTEEALARGDSRTSVALASFATAALYDPIMWAGLLSGGVMSVGALRFVSAANRAVPLLGSGETVLSRMAIAAVSEAAANAPFDVASVALDMEDTNTHMSVAEAAVVVGLGALFAGSVGATLTGVVETARRGVAIANLKRAAQEAASLIGKVDEVSEFVAKVQEANVDLVNDVGLPIEMVEALSRVAAADGFEVDTEDLAQAVIAMKKVAEELGDDEIARRAASQARPGVEGDGTTAGVDQRAEGSAVFDKADFVAKAKELEDQGINERFAGVSRGESSLDDLVAAYKDDISELVAKALDVDLTTIGKADRTRIANAFSSAVEYLFRDHYVTNQPRSFAEVAADAIDLLQTDDGFVTSLQAMSRVDFESLQTEARVATAIADPSTLDADAIAAASDAARQSFVEKIAEPLDAWARKRFDVPADEASLLDLTASDYRRLGDAILESLGRPMKGKKADAVRLAIGRRAAKAFQKSGWDPAAGVQSIATAAESSDLGSEFYRSLLHYKPRGDVGIDLQQVVAEELQKRISVSEPPEIARSAETRATVAGARTQAEVRDIMDGAIEYGELNGVSKDTLDRLQKELGTVKFMDSLLNCKIDG